MTGTALPLVLYIATFGLVSTLVELRLYRLRLLEERRPEFELQTELIDIFKI
jgi:hypothetical protein